MMLLKAAAPVMAAAIIVGVTSASIADVSASHRDENSEPECRCRARVSVEEPRLRYDEAGDLVVTPVVDVQIRTRGDYDAPRWTAHVTYSGSTEYSSRDVDVPEGTTFSGEKEITNGSCGTNYDWDGVTLSEFKVPGLHRGMLEYDEEIKGKIMTEAVLSVCNDVDDDDGRERFELEGPLTIDV